MRGKFTESELNLLATTLDGYNILERYLDQKELRVRELERQVEQCKKR